MKLKNTLFLLLVIAFVVAVAGCSDNNGSGVQQVKNSTESQTQSTPAEAQDVKGSLKNPAGINEVVTLESTGSTYEFSVIKAIRGDEANYIVKDANEFQEKPPTGYEYLLIDAKAAYIKGENSVYLSFLNFKAFSDNVERKNNNAILPNDYIKFEGGDVMPGGTKEGWVSFIVPQGKEVIIGFQPNSITGNTAYITLGASNNSV